MLHVITGNLLESDAEALVNAVNTVGVMGKGIALQFKLAYPGNFTAYALACKRGEVFPGHMFVCEVDVPERHAKYIVNFPTKRYWRAAARPEDIDAGLVDLVRVIRELGIKSIGVPALGVGNGGLTWQVVRPRIERALAPLADVRIELYEPRQLQSGR